MKLVGLILMKYKLEDVWSCVLSFAHLNVMLKLYPYFMFGLLRKGCKKSWLKCPIRLFPKLGFQFEVFHARTDDWPTDQLTNWSEFSCWVSQSKPWICTLNCKLNAKNEFAVRVWGTKSQALYPNINVQMTRWTSCGGCFGGTYSISALKSILSTSSQVYQSQRFDKIR